jgi:putative membrane protein
VADDGARDEPGAGGAPVTEPDYRFTLANERTFLAWQRTALGLLAAAVAVIQFVPSLSVPGARHALGLLLGALSVATATIGIRRWVQSDRAMRAGEPLPRQPSPVLLGVGLVVITLLALALVLTKAMYG